MAFQLRVDLQNKAIGWLRGETIVATVKFAYDRHEFESYMGNVG